MRKALKTRTGLLAAALGLLLTACTSPAPSLPSENPVPPASSSAPKAVTTEASAAAADDPLDNGGYAEYTWDDYVKGQRKMSGLTSWPEVERVRFVSPEETAEVQAQCRTSLGFPTTVESDGSYSTNITTEQEESLAIASYTCDLQYPTDLRYAQAFTRTQLRTIYAYYRDSLIPCLQGRGLDISPLPSEETYIEGTVTGTSPWTPLDSLDLSSIDTDAMNQECPGMPASDVLYGG